MKEVRIGLIGAGWMGKAHTNAFLNALMLFGPKYGKPVFEVVSDVNEDSAKAAAEILGYSRWTTNWKEVIEDPNVDVVDVASPNAFHYEAAKAALEAGKHVYCEKPLSISAEESKELAELAKEKGVVNFVGYNNVANPANVYIKSLVESGKLGKIMRFSGTYDQDMLLDPNIPISWRHINKLSGCGSLGDLGSHLLSVSQFVMGDIDKVNALSKTVIKERPLKPGSTEMGTVENDDTIIIMAEYANGAIGTLGSSRVATGRKNFLSFEIQGTEGTVYYSLEAMNEVHVYFKSDADADKGFRKVFLGPDHGGYGAFFGAAGIAIGYNDMKVLEVNELFSAIVKGTDYTCDFDFGYRIDRTIAAILESDKKNKWVEIEK